MVNSQFPLSSGPPTSVTQVGPNGQSPPFVEYAHRPAGCISAFSQGASLARCVSVRLRQGRGLNFPMGARAHGSTEVFQTSVRDVFQQPCALRVSNQHELRPHSTTLET